MKKQTEDLISGYIWSQVFVGLMVIIPLMLLAFCSLAHAQQTPIYDKDGKYQGSVFNYGKTQTYTDRDGKFSGSAVQNNNGTTSFSNRNGNFSGSAGPTIGPSGGRR